MLSVIIPTQDSEGVLVPTLAALVPGAAAGVVSEVVAADAGSNDQTVDIADIAGCRVVIGSGSLGSRLDAAARAARAPWLMFLRPDLVLDPTWIVEVSGFVAEAEARGDHEPCAAVFRPGRSGRSARPLVVEALALLRTGLWRRARPDQGLLVSKRFYRQLGGYRSDIPDPETDLLRRIGGRRTVTLRCAALRLGGRGPQP
jgi:glycosyltransferase involved in cell wall biosynthesis